MVIHGYSSDEKTPIQRVESEPQSWGKHKLSRINQSYVLLKSDDLSVLT